MSSIPLEIATIRPAPSLHIVFKKIEKNCSEKLCMDLCKDYLGAPIDFVESKHLISENFSLNK